MDLLFKTKKLIEQHELIGPGDHVLVAVSGGVDSMALSYLLNELRDEIGFLISIIHVNHGLRGKEADDDEKFVGDYCRMKEIPFHAVKWVGPGKGENVQEAARNFRYDSFSRVAQEIGADKVALAHNLDDQAETVLLNLIRGAGLDGICGMSFKKRWGDQLIIIRPLLDVDREHIESLAKEKGIAFRNDITNDQLKYSRNFIRHKIMPHIREVNPNASASIANMTQLLQLDEAYIQSAAAEVFDRLLIHQDKHELALDESGFRKYVPSIRTRVLKLAYIRMRGSVAGITKDHILKMDEIALSPKKEGSYNLPGSLIFERKMGILAILGK